MRKTILVAAVLLSWAALAEAVPFTMVSLSVGFDQPTDEYRVSVTFNQPPQLFTYDQYGRAKHDWAIDVAWDHTTPHPFGAITTDRVLRRRTEVDPHRMCVYDSTAWGSGIPWTLIGSTPFAVADCTLSFSLPDSWIDDQDGVWAYEAFTTEYGTTIERRDGVAPEPAMSLLSFAVIFCLIGCNQRVRRGRSQSRP
jgi:hypothetical protein